MVQYFSDQSLTVRDNSQILIRNTQQPEAVAQRCYVKKGFLRNFAKFTGKHLCQRLFFNKVPGLRPMAQVFFCEFCERSKNTFFTEHLRWLLLNNKRQGEKKRKRE